MRKQMEKSNIYAALDEVLELDEGTIKGGEILEEMQWESISIVSFIALIDEEFEIVLSAEEVMGCKTSDDLADIVLKANA